MSNNQQTTPGTDVVRTSGTESTAGRTTTPDPAKAAAVKQAKVSEGIAAISKASNATDAETALVTVVSLFPTGEALSSLETEHDALIAKAQSIGETVSQAIAWRDAAIIAAADKRVSLRNIAKHVGMSHVHVGRVVNTHKVRAALKGTGTSATEISTFVAKASAADIKAALSAQSLPAGEPTPVKPFTKAGTLVSTLDALIERVKASEPIADDVAALVTASKMAATLAAALESLAQRSAVVASEAKAKAQAESKAATDKGAKAKAAA